MKRLFLISGLCLLACPGLWSQAEHYTLNGNESGQTKTYIARDYIELLPGFTYQASGNNSFTAKIDASLLFPPEEGTYALPNGTLTSDPAAGAVVGSIPGQFAVSPMGAATYTLPIELPAGINGMQPNVSLVYNSQSGNGIAGWGWSLSGISAISKGAKTIFSDNAVSGIDLSAKSDYYLDGNKLCIKPGFIYGVAGSRYETENQTYMQIEQTASAGNYPSKFVVTGKDGTAMEYGQVVKPQNCTYPFQWLLNKITDANGNFMKYTYKTNSSYTQTVLDYIEYGSNGNAVAPLKIEFGYSVKTYVQKHWISGYYFEDYYLLQNISLKSNGTQLRNYDLAYTYRDEKHFLTGVTLTGENGEKLPATTIEWGKDYNGMWALNKPAVNTVNSPGNLAFFSDDMTGDGFSDLIEMRASGNHTLVRVYQASDTGDCNFTQYGIEKDFPVSLNYAWVKQKAGDYMTLRHYNKKWISMYVSNEHNTFFRLYDVSNTNNNLNTRDIVVANSQLSIFYTIADFNNDGNDEILYVTKTNIGLLSFIFSGTMLYLKQNPENVASENVFIGLSNNILDNPRNVFASDFNADGLMDVAVVGSSGIHIYKNNGGTIQSDGLVHCGFSFAGTVSLSMTDNESVLKKGDFNGDGLTDFIFYDGNNNFKWLLNNGNFGFTIASLPDITMLEDTGTNANDNKDDFIVADFNHDGKSDLIVIDAEYSGKNYSHTLVWWYASNGTSFTLKSVRMLEDEHYYYKGYATTGDFDGDGREDIFCYNADLKETNSNTNLKYKIHTAFNTGFSANLVTGIKNGMNVWQNIDYRPLTYSEDFYFKGSPSGLQENIHHHIIDIQAPLYCVKSASASWWSNHTGWTTVDNNSYLYESLKAQTRGKGMLGFEKIATKNEGTGMVTENVINYNYEYCVPDVEVRRVRNDGQIVEIQSDFQLAKTGKIISSSLIRQFERDFGAGLFKTTEYQYDAFGNLTKQRSVQGDLVQTDSIAYIQRGAWCVNKPGFMRTIASYQNQQDTVVKTFDYDNRGNPTREVLHPDKPLFKVTTEYGDYNAFGYPQTVSVKAKDKDGVERTRTTSQSYTASGRFVASQTDVLGQVTHYQWNETRGLLLSETDPWGRVTSHTYTHWGNRQETRYPDGNRTTAVLRWAGSGAPAGTKYYSYTQRSGNAPVLTWFDGLGQEIQRDTWGLNNAKISSSTEYYADYPNQGRLYRISEPYFENTTNKTWAVTCNAYDSHGRVTAQTTPLGQTTLLYNGRTTTVTTPEGTQSTTRNTSGFTASSTVNGKSVTYTYYPNGLTKTATPESGQALSMEYDPHGNRTKLIDPDAGEIRTRYNGFGELVEEKQKIHNSNDITTTHNYDPATGLPTTSVRNGETKTYTYDTSSGHPGRIKSIEIAGQHKQTYSYDDLSRVTGVKEEIDGRAYHHGTEYDVFGRVKKETFPTGYYTWNHYDGNGCLTRITDASNRLVWEALQENARGQLTGEKKGGKTTSYTYYNTGLPESVYAQNAIDNWYWFDTHGNLTYRNDYAVSTCPSENLVYDNQNRLTEWGYNDTAVYHPSTGNIQRKSDLGDYTMNYGANGKPHALTSISGVPDNFPAANLSITHTDFKKVKTLTEGVKNYTLTYGVDDQRRKSVYRENNVTKLTRYYLGDYEEEVFSNGNVRKIHYLGGAVLIQHSSGGSDSLLYVYADRQGSITALVNESGTVLERYAYDPWGKRRNPNNWSQADTRTSWILNRGYTGHEHLDAFGVINMNGRIYDPLTAQFLSPDPYVQAPEDWLNFNRYSYCLNNPFKYTDPSGENPFLIALGVYVLFFTDFGYDVQKTFLPVAVKIDLRLGNHQGAIGIDASIGLPQALPISYRVHGGATYFWKNEDLMKNNMSGWETRYGAEWGIGLGPAFKITYGGTTFNSKWGGKQTTNLITVGNSLINLKYENDMKPEGLFKYIPFVPKGDGDRYRTAAAQLNFGPFGIGTKMMTGDAGPNRSDDGYWEYINGKKTYIGNDGYNPNSHRMGIFYFKIGPFRFGKNSENTRKIFQNQFAHDFLTGGQSYWFEVLNLKPRWYWGFGYSGGGTLW